jgi:anti-anti-sigma regulatory factor
VGEMLHDLDDTTGLGVLMSISAHLKAAQVDIRVVAAEPRLRHRLPQCLRSQPIFFTVTDALTSQR